ncbi:MAG: response regulator transcription factor [Candidatus Competibacterales bacterium]
MRIALLDDQGPKSQTLRLWLAEAGHHCQLFERGRVLMRTLSRDSFDLVILDWWLPDMEGMAVLRWIRDHLDWPIPVLFITAHGDEGDLVQALENGADDYLVYPIKHREFLARIKALNRRAYPPESQQLVFDPYRIDVATRQVTLNGHPIDLTQKEFDLVLFLFRSAGRVMSRGHILGSVWGRTPDLNTRTVDTHISRIRSKLKLRANNGWQLKAVYQQGYRLENTWGCAPGRAARSPQANGDSRTPYPRASTGFG